MAGEEPQHAVGAAKTTAIDLDDHKLETARTMGATHTVNSNKTDLVEAVCELIGGFRRRCRWRPRPGRSGCRTRANPFRRPAGLGMPPGTSLYGGRHAIEWSSSRIGALRDGASDAD